MLVLTRKILESVVVGGSDVSEPMLSITVLEIAGGKVRLGFQANAAVPVHRLEVWERLRTGGRPAGQAPAPDPPSREPPLAPGPAPLPE